MTYLDGKPVLFAKEEDVPQPWPWKDFSPWEFVSRGNGQILVVPSFMDKLQTLRTLSGVPLHLSSGYRDPHYNDKVSHSGLTGPHTTGRAVDVKVYGEEALLVVSHAAAAGFTGIGLKQSGVYDTRYVHLDDLTAGTRPWIWTY